MNILILFLLMKESELRIAHSRTYSVEQTAYLLLKDNHEGYRSGTTNEIEDSSGEFQSKDKRYKEPKAHVCQYPPKQVDSS